MNPEKFMPKPQLSVLQKVAANGFSFNKKPNFILDGVITTLNKSQFGTCMKIIFPFKDQLYHSIIGTKQINLRKENVYFEISVEKFERLDFDVVIGFATEKSFNKEQAVGNSANSVGFHTKECMVVTSNSTKINYSQLHQLNYQYGDTIGIGYRPADGRVWFTYNGIFLNEMLSTEKKEELKKNQKKKKENEKEKEKEKEKKLELTEEQQQEIEERDQQLKKEIIKLSFQEPIDIYPVISANSKVEITLNYGAMNFMLFQKEIAGGLL